MCFFSLPAIFNSLLLSASMLLLFFSQTQSPNTESAAVSDVSATEATSEHLEMSEFTAVSLLVMSVCAHILCIYFLISWWCFITWNTMFPKFFSHTRLIGKSIESGGKGWKDLEANRINQLLNIFSWTN